LLASVDPALVSAEELRRRHPRLDELSFDSERKRMVTLHPWQEGYLLAAKGAPEVLVELCRQVETGEGVRPLDEALRREALDAAAEFGSRGLRTIAVAYRILTQQPERLEEAEQDLVLVGVAGMSDDTRPEARPAVEKATQAGIEVVMVTGDHQITAQAVAEQLGLLRDRRVMPGTQLRRLTVEELEPQVDQVGVYARVDPADKVKIVRAWQRREAIVAMTGDGINDAPALRAADIGVAMGSGTEVAKQSADMILADDNFASIVAAVEQGRGIFSNLKKVVFFLLSANISEVLVMLAGFMLFGAVGEPLLAVQLLWVNLVTDGLPAVALGMDPPAPDAMRRPPEPNRNLLGLQRQLRLLWQGGLLALGALAVFAYGHLLRGLPWEEVRSMAFTTLVVTQLAFAFVVRAQARSVWEVGLGGNRWLAVAVVGSLLLQLAVLYTPFGNHLFEVTPVAMTDWPVLLLAAGLPALAIDRLKAVIRARHPDWVTAAD
jgi:Ca2+-transporting ATPase